jgi:hypothetical protein
MGCELGVRRLPQSYAPTLRQRDGRPRFALGGYYEETGPVARADRARTRPAQHTDDEATVEGSAPPSLETQEIL